MSPETISGGVPMPENHATANLPLAKSDLFSVYTSAEVELQVYSEFLD
jgi:hypothetical protein